MKPRSFLRGACLALFAFPLPAAALGVSDEPTELTNGLVTLRIDPDDAQFGLSLVSVGDAENPEAYSLARTPLWQLVIRDPEGDGAEFTLEPDRQQGVDFKFDVKKLNDGYWYSTDEYDEYDEYEDACEDEDEYEEVYEDYEADGDPDDAIGARFRWRNVQHPDLPGGGKYDVQARVVLPAGKPYATFEFRVRSKGGADGQVLLQRFPRVEVIGGPNGPSERLAVPFWQGTLFENPINNPELFVASQFLEPEVHPGALNMQFYAYYDESDPTEAMLYWGSCDNDGYPKGFRIDPQPFDSPPALGLSIEHVPEGNGGSGIDDRTPYPFTLGVLRGDWYDAARFYREDWALEQPGPNKGSMLDNPDFSQTIRDADLFALVFLGTCPIAPGCAPALPNRPNDRSNWQFAAQHLLEIQQYFGTQDAVFQMYHWDANSFTRRWGEWFPISPNFLAFFAPQAALFGLTWAPYLHSTVLESSTAAYLNSDVPGFEGRFAGDFSIVDADGQLEATQSLFCPQTEVCDPTVLAESAETVILDEGTPFPSAYVRSVLERVQNDTLGGPSGVYLDVLQAAARVSYNPAPAAEGFHPVGGGAYWTAGRRQLLHDLRDQMRNGMQVPEHFVLGEAPYEPLIGEIEFTYGYHGGFRTQAGLRATVPLFQTVYHDYQRTGSILTLDVDPGQPQLLVNPNIWQAARQIYAANLWMGHAPYATSTVTSLTFALRTNPFVLPFPAFQSHLDMARRYVRLLQREEVRQHVVFGQRLRSPQTDAGRVLAGNLLVNDLNPLEETQPAVYAAVFGEPGPDGELGLLLMNWTDATDPLFDFTTQLPLFEPGTIPGPQSLRVTLSREQYGLAPATYRVREVVDGVAQPVPLAQVLDFDQPSADLEVVVPSRSARFFLIDREPSSAGL